MKKFVPYDYQQYCISKVLELNNIGLFIDMGLGKTVITLTALNILKYERFAIRKALVIAPKTVAEGTWTAEAAQWEHLKNLRLSVVLGTEKQRIAALDAPADIYVINRENVQWLVSYYKHAWPFDTVVLDESSSFKSHQAKRFKALKAELPRINRMIELTGTPAPHGLTDLWSQIYLLDQGKRLGRTITCYRDMFFVPDKRNQTTIFSYAPKEGAEAEIYRLISDICISMKSEDYLTLPEVMIDDIPVRLDAKAQKAYDKMEREALIEVDESEIVATSAAALGNKLLQLCNGAVYDEDKEVIEIHECKLAALLETIEQLSGQHAVVFYHFKHDRDRILAVLKNTGLRVRVYRSDEDKVAWNNGNIDILLAQPQSCGYGLNLQYGGHHVIWFGFTWNLEEYQQANKRLHRQGQKYPVIIHRLVTVGGTDEDVIKSLEGKEKSQDALLAALKARIAKARQETE